MLPPSKILGSYVSKAIFGDGCVVMADKIENSIVGNRSRIDKGSTLISTYMMGADYYQNTEELMNNESQGIPNLGVGKYCYIERAILDKNCSVGDNVRILGGQHLPDGDFEKYSIKDGIVVVKKNAVITSGTTIP